MESIFSRLELIPNYRDHLKEWCRSNRVKTGFLTTTTLPKARKIYKKTMLA